MDDQYITLEIPPSTSVFEYILRYGATFPSVNNFICDYVKVDEYEDNKCTVEMKLPYGITKLVYQDTEIQIDYQRVGDPVGLSHSATCLEKLTLSCSKRRVLEEFVIDAKKNYLPKSKEYVNVKLFKSFWTNLSKLPYRELDTVFLPQKVKDDLVKDIQEFLEDEEVYKKHGIPYKRTYLLEGLPGTGKTSLIFAIASILEKDVSIVNFNRTTDDGSFMNAVTNLPLNSILLIEDIDSLFQGRESKNSSQVTFSGILNTLDGIGRKNGMMTFITTNYFKRLDPALIRPGRIDYIVNFTYAVEEQVKDMFESYFLEQEFEPFYKLVKDRQFTTAVLQKFLFENRKCDDICEKVSEFIQSLIIYTDDSQIVQTMYF